MDTLMPVLAEVAVHATSGASSFERVIGSIPWFGWVAIIAIVSGSLSETFKAMFRHSERMAMIRMGIHPDAVDAAPGQVDGKPNCPEAAEL